MTPATAPERFGVLPRLGKPERVPLPRQLDAEILLYLVSQVPSRQKLIKPHPRADRAENLVKLYSAGFRRAHHEQSADNDSAWAQLCVSFGYPKSKAGAMRGSLWPLVQELMEAGVMKVVGEQDASGRWRRLRVVMLEPDPAAVAAAEAALGRNVGTRKRSRSSHGP